MIRILILAASLGCATHRVFAQDTEFVPITYVCDRGVEVPVVFVNHPDTGSTAVALIDNRLLAMRNVISASGARYRTDGDGDGDAYQLWVKGNTAVIFVGPDGDDVVLFGNCAMKP